MRLTRQGWVALVLALGLSAVAWRSGNNVLYLLVSPLWAMLALQGPLGLWNLRGLSLRRVLPSELFAGRSAEGALWLRREGVGRSFEVEVGDLGQASARCGELSSEPVRLAVVWRFPDRGRAQLDGFWIRSRWPFGLMEHRRQQLKRAGLLVYPRPLPSPSSRVDHAGEGRDDDARGGGAGAFQGIRVYQVGDSLRRIHWPTTARTGVPMVVERGWDLEAAVVVRVELVSQSRWERELSRACVEVLRAFVDGHRVGLVLPAVGGQPAQVLPPSSGVVWRRRLLDALAALPHQVHP